MQPVFVGGVPRSGTTQFAVQLGQHASVFVPPASRHLLTGMADLVRGRDLRWDALASSRHHRDLGRVGEEWLADSRAAHPNPDVRAFAECIRDLRCRQGAGDADYWVEHAPRSAHLVPALTEAFPEARFMLVLRDPRAVVASVLRLPWGVETSTPSLAARWWLSHFAQIQACTLAAPNVRWFSFEEMCESPERSQREAWSFLDLDHAGSGMSTFVPPKRGHGQSDLIGEALDRSRVNSWRRELTPWAVADIERTIGEEPLRGLGYEPSAGHTGGARTAARIRETVALLTRGRLWKIRAMNGRTTMGRN